MIGADNRLLREDEPVPEPPQPEPHEVVTLLVERAAAGDPAAADQLLPIVYEELRKLARWHMAKERPGHTLQPTALVHEAYLRLLGGSGRFENRRHFFAAAAEAMRRILIERARRRRRVRHGGDQQRVDWNDALPALGTDHDLDELLALHQVLHVLERTDPELALVVKLRHFAGMNIDEVAATVGVSVRTVNRQWSAARAWLKRELLRQAPCTPPPE